MQLLLQIKLYKRNKWGQVEVRSQTPNKLRPSSFIEIKNFHMKRKGTPRALNLFLIPIELKLSRGEKKWDLKL